MSAAKRLKRNITVRIHPKEPRDSEDDYDDDDDDEDDELGRQGEYECTRCFDGDILVGGQKAGSFSAHLIDRDRAGSMFHSACDAESGELQEFGCVLFSSSGAPRHPVLKSDDSVARGGFMYIDRLKVDAKHRVDGATDVGAAALRALLSCPELSGRWTVASYIADSTAIQTAEERDEDRARQMAAIHGGAETAEEKSSRVAGINERMAKDARQFLRAGFVEIAYNQGGWLCLTERMVQSPPTSHAKALAMPLRLTSSASAPSGGELTVTDGQLLEELMRSGIVTAAHHASALATVDRFVALGADLTRAGVLQFCVANGHKELLEPMLARGAQISGKDGRSGTTALMIAAEKVPVQTSPTDWRHDSTMVATLIALGADKDVVDNDGVSALGHYFKSIRSTNDFSATFGLIKGRKLKVDPTLRRMLTPAGGPTAADMDCADDH